MRSLGKHQLEMLAGLGSLSLLIVGDKLSDSLARRGYIIGRAKDGDSFFGITPSGLRALADEMESGALEHFFDPQFRRKWR